MNENFFNLAEFDFLDFLAIISFVMQLEGIKENEQSDKITNMLFDAIDSEIAKLHEENDIIIAQNEEIIKLLKEREK